MSRKALGAIAIAVIMVLSAVVSFGLLVAAPVGAAGAAMTASAAAPVVVASPSHTPAPTAVPAVAAPTVEPAQPTACSSLQSVNNDPSYASFVQNVRSIGSNALASGLAANDLHLPYTGPIATQNVNGQVIAGQQLDSECPQESGVQAASQTDPTGVAYNGQNNTNGVVRDHTIDSNSVAGILTVNSDQNFYPDSGTPTQWGGQENVVLPNVTILGQQGPSQTSTISFSVTNGVYSFSQGLVAGYAGSPSSGSVTVNGAGLAETVTYTAGTPTSYLVTFTESNLPGGTSWTVVLNGATSTSTTSTISIPELNGVFAYTVTAVAGYTVYPASGTVTVSGAPVGVVITFTAAPGGTQVVTFTESGLVWGTAWSVTLNSVTKTATTVRINFTEAAGTYPYSIGVPSGYTVGTPSGSVTVTSAAVAVAVAFTATAPTKYTVTFTESGLAAGTAWGLVFNGVASTATTTTYAFWVQNVISYDSFNDTISFVDDTWNFTTGSASMFTSSLAGWSPNGGNYTGVWVAFSPYYYCPPPFTVTAYVNTSVNSAGDQILWYNYSIKTPAHFISDGTYDYLIFNSQPRSGSISLNPPDFEASGTTSHSVHEGYEFDAFIGADDGSDQLDLAANATMQVQYCTAVPYCTPTHFSYANVPAAVNIGSQTGEQTVGIAVNFIGSTAYLSGGPLISHGLWNYTTQVGANPGNTKVINAITVSGSPLSVVTQPYFFVFFQSNNYSSQSYQWAPDVPAWYLMPGTYTYQIMLADYTQQNGTLVVGSTTATLTAVLPYNHNIGVYTPLWAFSNGQFAGISSAGSGTLGSQYIPFNNPTTGYFGFAANNLSANFYSSNDYTFSSFSGVLFDGTSAYVDLNAPPTFCVHTSGSTYYYLGIQLFETSHVTVSHDSYLKGWPAWTEISFYATVPASQNPAPQASFFVWNSTNDLVMSNTFIGTAPSSGHVAPTELVLYGGSNNVVWGNTFRDPINSVPSLTGSYAGIGLAESGDLIYNNNFTVDNPVVYLPYNWANVADCLPQSQGGCATNQNPTTNGWYYNVAGNVLGGHWNITPQSASNVAETINSFPLSGNVLGASVTTQGGNYFWNYGSSPNNRSTSPYVSRFYFSDWSIIFPLGCGTIQAPGAPCGTEPPVVGAYQNGITAGGDFAPYGPTVTFSETGLAGTWAVTLNGKLYDSSTASISIPVAYGTYSYIIGAVAPGYVASPITGSVTVNGIPTVHVTFTPTAAPTYTLYFTESGLAAGSSWSVQIGAGAPVVASTSTISIPGELAGVYSYTISGPAGYTPSPASGSVTVSTVSMSVSIAFALITDSVTFTETGLAPSTLWAVSFGGVIHWSTSTTITFAVVSSTYSWTVGIPTGYVVSSQSTTSPTVVSGTTAITIGFTP